MKKRCLFTILALLFLLSAAAEETPKTASPDEAKPVGQLNTVADIEKAVKQAEADVQKEITALRESGERNPEAVFPYVSKRADYLIAAGERILKIAKDDAEKRTGYTILLQGWETLDKKEKMQHFSRIKQEEGSGSEEQKTPARIIPMLTQLQSYETAASKKIDAIYAEIEKEGKFSDLAAPYRYKKFTEKAAKVYKVNTELTLENFAALKEEAFQEINKTGGSAGSSGAAYVKFLLRVAGSPKAKQIDAKLAEDTLNGITAFIDSAQCTLAAEQKEKLFGDLGAKQRRAFGAGLKLYGKTLDDKDFDWDSLRGKFVLVKFTASWCGPCKGEIPGMKEAYEKYHDKGLEIVSVYVRDKLDASKNAVEKEKLPWIIISEELTQAAGGRPQGEFYGVEGVPTMLLVGEDGRVLAVNTRGEVLKKKLAELLRTDS
ncbi:MAG: TlpA family protein disulfide reductase [Planctomycetaceae bacterium]|jgi:thiol-disulfide isomerase/thioredoxin|nr:TlpA family protein disulfide reductase [Planctomycetaceae bacterium]